MSTNSPKYTEACRELKDNFSEIWDLAKIYGVKVLLFLLKTVSKLKGSDFIWGIAALIYWVVPIDLIPDFIPFVGYLDDLMIALIAAVRIISNHANGISGQLSSYLEEQELSLEELLRRMEEFKTKSPNLSMILEREADKQKESAEQVGADDDQVIDLIEKAEVSIEKETQTLTQKELTHEDFARLEAKIDKLMAKRDEDEDQ